MSSAPTAGGSENHRQLTVGAVARALSISFEEVEELCEVGTLQARRTRSGFWLIDEHSLIRWREANPATQPVQSVESPCPPGACEAHWLRRGQVIPEFRAGLCRRCFSGRLLPTKKGGAKQEPETVPNERGVISSETISVTVAARIARCSHDTLVRLIEEGVIEAWRFPPRGWYKINRSSLARFLSDRMTR